jgi:hypothetical protein
MSQILAVRGEVRNHPLTFEFAIEYNKGVGSRRTAPAQGIETPTAGHPAVRTERGFLVTKDRPCAGD